MNIVTLLFMLTGVAVIWGIVAGIRIFEFLRRRGENVSFIWIRLMLPVYVHRYAKITRAETGKTGPLFYHYVVAFSLALAAMLAAVVVRSV